MGITASKNSLIVDDFDGQGGDHDLAPEDVKHDFDPEWLLTSTELKDLCSQAQELDKAPEDLPKFSFNGQLVTGKCVKVYDGDTVHFVVRYNGMWIRRRFRMIGYNSPEIRGSTPEEKDRAFAARDYLAERLLGKKAVLYLHDFDKWGRVLCDVYILPDNLDSVTRDNIFKDHINTEMIEKGHGVAYYG